VTSTLILKRGDPSRQRDNDYDVLEERSLVASSIWRRLRRRAAPGCGRAATAGTSSGPRTAMSRPREGDGDVRQELAARRALRRMYRRNALPTAD
jgi:hypothetical protein